MSVTVSGGFRQLDPKQLQKAIDQSLKTAGIMLEGEVASRANENVDTGRHKGSITWATSKQGSQPKPDNQGKVHASDKQSKPLGSTEVHIGSAVEYAQDLEYGTSPHVIKAKNGKYLTWKGADGQFHSKEQVNHPGTRAYPHFRNAFDENRKRVTELFHKKFKEFIQRADHS